MILKKEDTNYGRHLNKTLNNQDVYTFLEYQRDYVIHMEDRDSFDKLTIAMKAIEELDTL